jgi:2-polyprenyl-6-methoxyphenol hydroxylase-like FAD-dependent oxidoreductase
LTVAQVGRILIVGGGIGGLSAAIALRMAGFRVAVFEQAAELREAGAGVALWSNALASLDQLGVGEAVRAGCRPLRSLGAVNAKGRVLSHFDLDQFGPEFASAACHVVLRPVLLAALAGAVPRDCVYPNSRAVAIEAEGTNVRLRLASGRIEEGELLIGADGLHSVVRPLVAGADVIRYSGQTCFRGVARVRAGSPAALREVHGIGHRGSVCPVDDEIVYWWACYNAPPDAILPQADRKTELTKRFHGWPFGLPEAISATPVEAILQNDLVDRPPTRRYASGRLVLLGDAAHPTTPNLGQGANMAIDDAIVLARALRQAADVPEALGRYQRERLPRTRLIVKRSWNYGRMCLWTSRPAVWFREAAIRHTPRAVIRSMLRWQILEGVGTLI